MNYRDLKTNELKYVVYCRKSSEGEDKQIQSLETQLRELEEHARRNELNIVEIISESKSAFKTGRKGFERMMKLISTDKANAILVIRANRISRNPIDAGSIVSVMDEKKLLYVRTPNSSCYTCSSSDKMMLGFELLVSKKDSDEKGDMVKDGQKTKALKGYPHGVASLGFLNDKTEERGNRKWKVDKLRLDKIKILLDMFLTGTYSAGKMFKYAVEELKLNTISRKKIGGKLIAPSRIYEILTDPIYAGFFFQGGKRYPLAKELPRLITEDQHEKIKIILSGRNIPKTKSHHPTYAGYITSPEGDYIGPDVKYQMICDCKHKFAYMSRTHCPVCNKEISQMDTPKYLDYTFYYNVKKKKKKEACKFIGESYIDKEMLKFIDTLDFSNDLIEWTKKNIVELRDQEVVEKIVIERSREERKIEFEKDKDNLRVMLRKGYFTEDEYQKDLKSLSVQYSDVDESVKKVDWYSEIMNIIDVIQTMKDIFLDPRSTKQSKREIMSRASSNLIWDEKNLYIYSIKPINVLIEGIKGIKSNFPWFEPKKSFIQQGLNEKTGLFLPVFSSWLRG